MWSIKQSFHLLETFQFEQGRHLGGLGSADPQELRSFQRNTLNIIFACITVYSQMHCDPWWPGLLEKSYVLEIDGERFSFVFFWQFLKIPLQDIRYVTVAKNNRYFQEAANIATQSPKSRPT